MKYRIVQTLVVLFLIQALVSCGGKKETVDAMAPNFEEMEPNNTSEQAQPVTNGTIAKGFINEKLDQDWYKISIPPDSSTILRAELTGIENINLKLELFDASQNLLLEVDRLKESEPEILTNYELKPGAVFLRVRELWLKSQEKKFNDTLAYNLRIHLNEVTANVELEPNMKAIKSTLLRPDSTIRGYISPYNDVDWFRLPLPQNGDGYLQLTLSGVENVDLKLKVYDPIEALIYSADDGKKGEGEKISNLGIDFQKEFYYVVVAGDKWQTNETQRYELQAKFIPAKHDMEFEPNDRLVKATALVDGDSVLGFIDRGDDVDWYFIQTNAVESHIAKIEVHGIPHVDFKMTLTNELEEPILIVNETGEQENERITNIGLLGNNKYYLKLESVNKGANVEDPYSVFLLMIPFYGGEEFELNNSESSANLIEVEKAIAGYIHPVGDVDFYQLILPNRYSGKLEIILEGMMKVNTDLTLYNNSMNVVAKAAAKPAEGIERLTFDAFPGIYYIQVYDNDGKESNYRDKYKLAIFVKPD